MKTIYATVPIAALLHASPALAVPAGQVFGDSNSFVRNSSQVWSGNNSVFNNPG